MVKENNVPITCNMCSTILSVPSDYSGKIICVKCRNQMHVDESTTTAETNQTGDLVATGPIRDVDLIDQRLRSIEESIRGVSTAIWMVFLVIPFFLFILFIVSF